MVTAEDDPPKRYRKTAETRMVRYAFNFITGPSHDGEYLLTLEILEGAEPKFETELDY